MSYHRLLVNLLIFALLGAPVASSSRSSEDVSHAVQLLESLGVPTENLCTIAHDASPSLPLCTHDDGSSFFRHLEEEEEEPSLEEDPWFFITHCICAAACVVVAALAAGLTMGLLSLDPLMLLIKMRAGATERERKQAAQLLPIVKQHHLLLVTLLLLNSIANEALPLFLEVLVSPIVAVVLSVTLVLFFGEIIPSAVFTGPNKIELASKMTPLVKLVMFLLWPISFPIAKLLDHVLHDDDESTGDAFNRGELSALVRIQYEERLAAKQERKKQREAFRQAVDGASGRSSRLDAALRSSKREIIKESFLSTQDSDSTPSVITNNPPSIRGLVNRSPSIHLDEVSMVEGALQMKTKVAMDVFTPIHRMFSVSHDMILTERNVVSIYSSGYSRVPVFETNPERPKNKTAICGILKTKQLIVVNPNGNRPLQTLPLYTPMCVSPKMNLVDLLNYFQTGRVGHLALVCARPKLGQDALNEGRRLPETAGLMGCVIF
jgi:metal transporter CNNM